MSQRHLAPLATGALLALLTASSPAQAAADGLLAAGIDHGALVVRAGTGPVRIVQGGGAARLLPVWSADGTRIAFVQLSDRRQALAELVVVTEAGVELARVAIEPVMADTAYAGMRFVEAVRWIAPDRVAVRGSLNPSQSQYYVVDVASGRVVDDFIDDRSSAAFSPDGRHVATQSGSPHFLPADRRVPQLNIDGRPVYAGAGRADADIVAEPRWSADSRSLAWLLRLKADGSTTLAVWRDGTMHESAVPAARGTQPGLFWQGTRVVVTAASASAGAGNAAPKAWAFDATGGAPKPLAAALDPLNEARSLRDRLAADARAAGLGQPDLWCRACGLEALPRASE